MVVFLVASLCCLLWDSAYPAIKNGYALFNIAQGDIASKLVCGGIWPVIKEEKPALAPGHSPRNF